MLNYDIMTKCFNVLHRRGQVLVRDSNHSDWIYVVKSVGDNRSTSCYQNINSEPQTILFNVKLKIVFLICLYSTFGQSCMVPSLQDVH